MLIDVCSSLTVLRTLMQQEGGLSWCVSQLRPPLGWSGQACRCREDVSAGPRGIRERMRSESCIHAQHYQISFFSVRISRSFFLICINETPRVGKTFCEAGRFLFSIMYFPLSWTIIKQHLHHSTVTFNCCRLQGITISFASGVDVGFFVKQYLHHLTVTTCWSCLQSVTIVSTSSIEFMG